MGQKNKSSTKKSLPVENKPLWLQKWITTTMIFITLPPSGGDYRWCLHVCKRPPSPEREETLRGDRQHGAGLVEWSHQLQDPPSSGVQAATSDRSTHGRVCRRGGRHGHAQVLLVRRHRQHGFQNGVYRERYIGRQTLFDWRIYCYNFRRIQ